jgi:hypothetical protein
LVRNFIILAGLPRLPITSYENIITEQEKLLANLRQQLNELSAIYQTQSQLSRTYDQRLRFWRTFTLIGIPTAALLSGLIVWVVN